MFLAHENKGSAGDDFKSLDVTGMTCQGCVRRLSAAFESEGLALGKEVNVELGRVTVLQKVSVEKVEAVNWENRIWYGFEGGLGRNEEMILSKTQLDSSADE